MWDARPQAHRTRPEAEAQHAQARPGCPQTSSAHTAAAAFHTQLRGGSRCLCLWFSWSPQPHSLGQCSSRTPQPQLPGSLCCRYGRWIAPAASHGHTPSPRARGTDNASSSCQDAGSAPPSPQRTLRVCVVHAGGGGRASAPCELSPQEESQKCTGNTRPLRRAARPLLAKLLRRPEARTSDTSWAQELGSVPTRDRTGGHRAQ